MAQTSQLTAALRFNPGYYAMELPHVASDQDGSSHPDGRQCGAAEARAQLLRQRPPMRGARVQFGVGDGSLLATNRPFLGFF